MNSIVERVPFPAPAQYKLKRIAAYARVSSGKDAMLHSLSTQVSYYSDLIQRQKDWQYCGVYADEALTGTKGNRDNFQRMVADCRAGKIDMVITKSISRFARNTVTLLETVRELKEIGVDVFFEEQNIHSMSPDGELLLTILAAYAQEESLSVSENMKWRIRHDFEQGLLWSAKMYGYNQVNRKYEICPEEASVVREIFAEYLAGNGIEKIQHSLNERGIRTKNGGEWHKSSITRILRNYSYTGNLIQMHKYRENHISKKTIANLGELPMYHAVETHEPIIEMRTFLLVQEEILKRAEKYTFPGSEKKSYPFTGIISCGNCGKNYRRKSTATGPVWICSTYNSKGKRYCASKAIPEGILESVTLEVLKIEEITEAIVKSRIKGIRVREDNTLEFVLSSGQVIVKQWKDRSRAESWTTEKREAAGKKTYERWHRNGNS